MTLAKTSSLEGGSYASLLLYRPQPRCPRTCSWPDRKPSAPDRLQCHVHHRRHAPCALQRRRPPDLRLRGLCRSGAGALGRDHAPGGPGHLARLRPTAKGRQSRFGGRLAKTLASTRTTAGHRLAPGALLWRGPRRGQGYLPLQGGERDQQLLCLRQRLRRVQGPTLHGGVDAGGTWRDHEGGGSETVDAGPPGQRAAASFAAGSRVLFGRGDSLSSSSTRAVLDAGSRTGQKAARGADAHGHRRLSDVETRRLDAAHLVFGQKEGDGVDLRVLRRLPRPLEKAWAVCLGVRVLGDPAAIDAVGSRDVSAKVQHRDELSAVERGADQDVHARVAGAVFLCGIEIDPEECVGVAALGGAVESAAGSAAVASGAVAVQDLVGMVAACGRIRLGYS